MKRSRTAFVLGLAMVVLSACSEDPVPKVAPHESPAPSVSESASPTGRDLQQQFIRDYFQSITNAIATGNPSPFISASSPQCQNCRVLADNLTKAYSNGGHIEGGSWQVQSADFQRTSEVGDVWMVSLQTARERWYNGADHVVKVVRPASLDVGVALEARGDGWEVRELRLRG